MFLKKDPFVNKYKKQMRYINNKSLFFNVKKNVQIFSSRFCHFQFDHRFLFSREMGSIASCKEVRP